MTKSASDDTDLNACLLKIAQGDRVAFQQLFEATQSRYLSVVQQLVGDREAASDIVQQSYVRIWTKADQFDPERGEAFVWMLVIMRRKAIDYLRSAYRMREQTTDQIDLHIEDTSERADVRAAAMLQRRILQPALAKLPEKLREAVLLHVVQELTCAEIGERLDIPRNTAKSRVRRGLTALREYLPMTSMDNAV